MTKSHPLLRLKVGNNPKDRLLGNLPDQTLPRTWRSTGETYTHATTINFRRCVGFFSIFPLPVLALLHNWQLVRCLSIILLPVLLLICVRLLIHVPALCIRCNCWLEIASQLSGTGGVCRALSRKVQVACSHAFLGPSLEYRLW